MAGRPKRRGKPPRYNRKPPEVAAPSKGEAVDGSVVLHSVPVPKASVQRAERMWKPFTLGNTAAMKTGAYSARVVDPVARDLAEWLAGQEDLPFLGESSFAPAVMTWAQRKARADLLHNAMAEHHEETGCFGCQTCVSWEERWRQLSWAVDRSESRLGLDPQARAEILLRLQAAKVIQLPNESDGVRSMLAGMQEELQAWAEAQGGDDE